MDAPKPDLRKPMTMAHRYEKGEELDHDIEREQLDFDVSTCGHTRGICDCDATSVQVDVEIHVFSDGSVYVDDVVEGAFVNAGEMEEAVIEQQSDEIRFPEPPDIGPYS